jgi:hypothetical protein
MTEQEWLTSTHPWKLLKFLRGKASERKLRLFACEALRIFLEMLTRCFPNEELRLPRTEALRKAPAEAARFADGLAGAEVLDAARDAAYADHDSHRWLEYACWVTAASDAWAAASETDTALRAFLGDEFPPLDTAREEPHLVASLREDGGDKWQADLLREVFGNPFRPLSVDPVLLQRHAAVIPKIARSIYDERAFDRLPVLADALEEAGCVDVEILNHCRLTQPGPHVRGCWVVDVILSRDR